MSSPFIIIDEINSKIDGLLGATGNTGGSTSAGTVMAKLNKILTDWTATRAGYIDTIKTNTDRVTAGRATIIDNVGSPADINGTYKIGTVHAKLSTIVGTVVNPIAGTTFEKYKPISSATSISCTTYVNLSTSANVGVTGNHYFDMSKNAYSFVPLKSGACRITFVGKNSGSGNIYVSFGTTSGTVYGAYADACGNFFAGKGIKTVNGSGTSDFTLTMDVSVSANTRYGICVFTDYNRTVTCSTLKVTYDLGTGVVLL